MSYPQFREEYVVPGGKDVTITDKNGTPWTVSEKGKITTGEAAEGGKPTANNTQGISANGVSQITAQGVTVTFNDSGFYYYDAIPNRVADKLTAVYDYLPITDGGEYAVPYKAISNIPSHENDIITATATFTDKSITKDDIVFKTKDGIKVNARWEGNTATLQLQQKFDYAVEEILATVKPKDSARQYTVAGVFKHVHLAAQELKAIDITLVPVQRDAISNGIKAQINAIYNKAGADFNITIDPPLDITKADWDLDGNDTIDVGDSGLLSQYTEEERAIFRYYKNQRPYDKKRYYVFVLGQDLKPSSAIEGFMPLGRQYGFVFNPSNLAKTIAHELGHGVFGLSHPWDTYNFEPGQTDWLMDNSPNGTALNHMNWEQMHSGGINIYAFQDDEEGESARLKFRPDKKFTVKIDGVDYFQFLTPTGQVLNIEYDKLQELTFYFGIAEDKFENLLPSTLYSFKVKEGDKVVDYKLSFSNLESDGYKNANGNYFEPKTNAVKNKNILLGYASPKAGEEGFIMAKHNYNDATSFDFSNTNKALLNVNTVNFYPNATNKLYRQFYNDRLLTGSSQQSITADYRNTIKGHDEGDEFLVLLKIAEWRARYPFFFDKFTTTFDAWTRGNLKKETRANGRGEYLGIWNEKMGDDISLYEQYLNPTTKIEFYKSFLAAFKAYAINGSNENRDCLANLKNNIDTITVEEVLSCIDRASQDELKLEISQDARQEVIKLLLSETWVDGASEEAIVKLFQYTPKNFDSDRFFEFFENTCNSSLVGRKRKSVKKCLWSLLFNAVDDSDIIFSGDNRQALMLSILPLFKTSKRFEEAQVRALKSEVEFVKANTYVFDYKNIFARLVSGKYESLNTSVTSEGTLRVAQTNSNNDRVEIYSPFDVTLLVNKSLLEKSSIFKSKDKNGNPIALAVPAIVLHYINTEAVDQTTKDVIITTFDVASLALTGTPASQLAKVFIYADKVSSIASIAGTAFREDIPELANLFNTVSIATGVTSLGSFALNATAIKALTKSDDVKHIEDVLSSIETLKNNDALDALSQLKKSDTDDGVEAIIELLERNKITHADEALLVERVENAIRVLESVKETKTLVKAAKSIEQAVAFLKTDRKFSDELIDKQFFNLFEASTEVKKLDVAKIDNIKLEGLNYFITGNYDNLYELFKKYRINYDSNLQDVWPPFNGFIAINKTLKGKEIKNAGNYFDRFQTPYNKQSVESLRGGFLSPIFISKYRGVEIPINFTYESRALLTGIEENLVYINFKFNNVPSDMTLHVGKSMPWGVSKGNAIQYMSNKQLQSLREGIHYEVIEKMIYRGAKWRRVPYGVQNYGKQLDNILDKVKCK